LSEVLNIALSQVGVQEEPKNSNWGPRVCEYLKIAGINVPAPWCMAFVVWCHRFAGVDRKQLPVTASCTYLLNWAREQGKLTKQPRPGDIFLLLRPGGKTSFHTGIIRNVSPLYFGTVEGNSNDAGSAEGYEVCRRTRRRVLARVAFVRIDN
jgi:hypothetical protein